MKKIVYLLIIVFFLVIPSLSNIITNVSSSLTNIIYVNDDGDADYINIQDAINIADNGDLIFVYEGVYNENLIINKSIFLTGENKNNTIIDGNGINDGICITSPGTKITGFTIQNNGNSGRDSGIKIFADNTIISSNNIINNTVGIFIGSSNNCQIEFNYIYSNRDSGIHILNSYENNISSNYVYNNRWGIFSTLSYNNTIEKNIIHSNKVYGIWLLRHNYGNIINRNIVTLNNEFGIYLLLLSGYNQIHYNYISSNTKCGVNIGNYWPCDGNTLIGNTIIKNNNLGVSIQDSRGSIVSRNNFIDNRIDATFNNCYDTSWNYNYWNETRNLPKIIQGNRNLLPWVNFDWYPESQPYNYSNYFKNIEFKYFIDKEKHVIFSNLPTNFSWSNINGVDFTTSVKNQNPAPTCEAYALCVSLETIAQYQIGYPFGCDLSEAHLFFNSGGTCNWGVDIQETVEYLIDYGVPDEGCFPDPHRPYDFPYESVNGWENRTIKIKEWGWIDNNVESIKKALIKYGPLVICQMTRKDLDFYKQGIYMPKISSPIQRGHVVTIIGYDDNQRCWTIRNSGGINWGEKGHFRISYDAFDPYYSFIYPFYGGTGILYINNIYGNLNPDVPKIEIETPKIFHTYLLNQEIKTLFKQISDIQRGAPRVFGNLTIKVNTSNSDKVEFLLDGNIQHTDYETPFKWDLRASSGIHTLETIAYNRDTISKDIIDIFIV
jgi:parallel beta-helix repeat protein